MDTEKEKIKNKNSARNDFRTCSDFGTMHSYIALKE